MVVGRERITLLSKNTVVTLFYFRLCVIVRIIQIVEAPGKSCRRQVKDGAGAKTKCHVEILYESLVR